MLKKISVSLIFVGLMLAGYVYLANLKAPVALDKKIDFNKGPILSEDIDLQGGIRYKMELIFDTDNNAGSAKIECWMNNSNNAQNCEKPFIEFDWQLLNSGRLIAHGGTMSHELAYPLPKEFEYQLSNPVIDFYTKDTMGSEIGIITVKDTKTYHLNFNNIYAFSLPDTVNARLVLRDGDDGPSPFGYAFIQALFSALSLTLGIITGFVYIVRKLISSRQIRKAL